MKQKPDEDHFSKRCQWFESCCEQQHTSTLISGLWSRLWLSVQLTECSHVDACKVETSWIYSSETYFWGCKHNFPSNKKPQQFKFPFDKFWVVDTAINSRHIFLNSYRSSGLNIKLSTPAPAPPPPEPSRPHVSWDYAPFDSCVTLCGLHGNELGEASDKNQPQLSSLHLKAL